MHSVLLQSTRVKREIIAATAVHESHVFVCDSPRCEILSFPSSNSSSHVFMSTKHNRRGYNR